MKTTTTETFKYDDNGCLIEKVTVVECDDPSTRTRVVRGPVSIPKGIDEHALAAAAGRRPPHGRTDALTEETR